MQQAKAFGLVGVLLLAGSLTLRADVWDLGAENDDAIATTQNNLIHGSDQVHDLAAKGNPAVVDVDFFQMRAAPYSSYYATIDGTTGDLDAETKPLLLTLTDDAATVILESEQVASGSSRHLRFQNATENFRQWFIQVHGAQTGCTTTCTGNSQYRIHFYDTTISVPRYNAAGGQVTILMTQNATNGTVEATSYFWRHDGTLLHSVPVSLPPRSIAFFNTSTSPVLQNTTGTISVSHTAGIGGLAVKAVALEPATGFSFDTPGQYRPH